MSTVNPQFNGNEKGSTSSKIIDIESPSVTSENKVQARREKRRIAQMIRRDPDMETSEQYNRRLNRKKERYARMISNMSTEELVKKRENDRKRTAEFRRGLSAGEKERVRLCNIEHKRWFYHSPLYSESKHRKLSIRFASRNNTRSRTSVSRSNIPISK